MKLALCFTLLACGVFATVQTQPSNATILVPVLNDTQLGPTLPPNPWDDCGWGPGTDCK